MNPFWTRLHLPVSVHNLGGCVMADAPTEGVTSAIGEVHNYPGLYVLDGAILPSATGVNPSSTIAAVAERNIEAIIRQLPGKGEWKAPEWPSVKPIHDPVSALTIPAEGCKALATPSLGLEFTETMKGAIALGHNPIDDYRGAAEAGLKAGTLAEFTLTIRAPDLDAFLVDRTHAGIASGTLRLDGITPPEGARVTAGIFNLFVDTDSFYERKMLYQLPFFGKDGKPYLLDGYKEVKDHGHFDVWGATSTLYTVIREGHTKTGAIVASGVLTIHIFDFAHQMTTFKIPGARNPLEKADALARFGKVFMGTLWDVFARAKFEL
jgi:cholesterol oxidase